MNHYDSQLSLIIVKAANDEKFKGTSGFSCTVAVGGCHVNCNFKVGDTCRITVIFGTWKDGSALINNLASDNCFS